MDFLFFGNSLTNDKVSKTKLAADFAPFIFSLLHGAAFCGAMYIALETVLNGQYDISVAGGLSQCAIGFTALYIIAEIANTCLTFKDGDEGYALAGIAANIGMLGMVGCAIAAMVEYCKSSTHMPSIMLTLTEKLDLSAEAICGIAAGAIAGLLLLWAISEILADKANGKQLFEDESRLKTLAGLEAGSWGWGICC